MTQVKLIKVKFKPGGKEIWLDWAEELKRRKDEVIATLKNEGVVSEACFISEDGEYVYYFMEGEDLKKAREASLVSSHPIDADHKKAREGSFGESVKLECLFHFENR
jgi:hypothetical protein